MKSMRIPLITLALTLGAASAAWGAESVMNLISSGEAVQKEVMDTKAKAESTDKLNKELASQGKELSAANTQLNADIASLNKDAASIAQRKTDFTAKCGDPNKHLTTDEVNACKVDAAQINADIQANTAKNGELKKRQDELFARIGKYNEAIKTNPGEQKSAYDAFNAATKKEGAWLDAAREQMSSEAFKSYGAKAGCPDVNKTPKTTDAMIKMTDDVIACLKKVSNS
jgi:cell division protein FtsB